MPKTRTYLDHNASAPLLLAAKNIMLDVFEMYGNPSAIHKEGQTLKAIIDEGRQNVAKATGAKRDEVVFSGSATESINQAIIGGVNNLSIDCIIISAGEHAASLKAAKATNAEIIEIYLLENGYIDLDQLKNELAKIDKKGQVALVCMHEVNNETGIIQPIGEIEKLVGPSKHFLFIDAVQAMGKIDLDFSARPIDMMAISSHKIGGPVGIGALLTKPHCFDVKIIHGGGQEDGRRSGTSSTALIAGFGAAAIEFPKNYDAKFLGELVKQIEEGLKKLSPDVVIFGKQAKRMDNIVNFAIPNLKSSVILMGLDLDGIAVSAGSACASGRVTYSHVLCAMGISPNLATGRIRLSLGYNSTKQDVEAFLGAFEKILNRHKNEQEK